MGEDRFVRDERLEVHVGGRVERLIGQAAAERDDGSDR